MFFPLVYVFKFFPFLYCSRSSGEGREQGNRNSFIHWGRKNDGDGVILASEDLEWECCGRQVAFNDAPTRTMNEEACSSGAGPPPSKRLRLLRNRQVCASGSRRTPLNKVDHLHLPHLEQQQQTRAASAAGGGRFPVKDRQHVGGGTSPSASHSHQRTRGESSGNDTSVQRNDVETAQLRVDFRDSGPSEQAQHLSAELTTECISSAPSRGLEQTLNSWVTYSLPVDRDGGERKSEKESAEALTDADDTSSNNNACGLSATRVQQERVLDSETAQVERAPFANAEICHADRTRVVVDDTPGSRIPFDDDGELMVSSASLLGSITPVEVDLSSLTLAHQIVRDLEVVHHIVREEQDRPSASELSSHHEDQSTEAAVEPVSPCESPISGEEDTSLLRTGERPVENMPGWQDNRMESVVNPAVVALVSEGSLPLGSIQLLVESSAGGDLPSTEENRIAENVGANSLERAGDLAETNEVQSTNLQQNISEEQVTFGIGAVQTSVSTEGRELPAFHDQVIERHVEVVDLTEDEDITADDVVNILARTSRIVRAIEAYSMSPDRRTTENHSDTGAGIFNAELQSEVQHTSRSNHQIGDRAGEVFESTREVTTDDVANIYAQAGAIAEAASNWFALSESARNRATGNININANWGSLVQENARRERGSAGENANIDCKRTDGASDQSVLQTQEPNATDVLSCPICMEPWTNTGEHRICSLACGHLFGKSCIKRWIKQGGRRIGKCPHCNKRAKVEDLRNIYVPHIAVADGHGREMDKEVKRLKSENEELKRMNSQLHLEMARLGMERDRLRHLQAVPAGAGVLQKVEHSRLDDHANARKRQAQASLQTFFGGNDRRRSRRRHDEHRFDERHSKVHIGTGGHRSSSSLACIGSRGLGENFILQDEKHLLGAKVFDMDDHSQMALVSNKTPTHGSTFGLTKISLLNLSGVQHISLPPGLGAIRDVRFSPSGIGIPGKLALIASLGKKLSLFSLENNTIVLDYPLQSPSWSCAWDSGVPNQVYAGLQNGSLMIFDLRQTSSPMASFPGCNTRPVHTLQSVESQARKGILSASNSGTYFWDMGSSASFAEIQRPLCISDEHKEKLCVSLAYASCFKTAVASFRPSPLAQTEVSSSAPAASQVDNSSQLSCTVRRSLEPSSSTTQQITNQDSASHCVFSSRFVDSLSSGLTDESKGRSREWRWEAGKALMVGHKSVSVMPRSTIIVEPVDDVGLRATFACGDEGTNAVWLWDMNTLNVTQTLVPHQSPVLDVKYVNIGERILMGCISEKTFQLYRRPATI